MTKFWVRWFHKKEYGAFEICSPWWISGEHAEGPVICAAIKARNVVAACKIIRNCYDVPCLPTISFAKSRADDWSPYCSRFQEAAWMAEYWDRPEYHQDNGPCWCSKCCPNAHTITDAQLADRWPRIQPIVRDRFGGLRYIKPVDPENIVYHWAPEFRGTVPRRLVVLARNERVLITWSYYGLFKATIRECLAQMPAGVVNRAVAFEIVDQPATAHGFYRDDETKRAFNAGYHTCTVVYYGVKS